MVINTLIPLFQGKKHLIADSQTAKIQFLFNNQISCYHKNNLYNEDLQRTGHFCKKKASG